MVKNCSKFTHTHTRTHTRNAHSSYTSSKKIPRYGGTHTHSHTLCSSNRLLFVIKFPTSEFIIHTVVSLFVVCSSDAFGMMAYLSRTLLRACVCTCAVCVNVVYTTVFARAISAVHCLLAACFVFAHFYQHTHKHTLFPRIAEENIWIVQRFNFDVCRGKWSNSTRFTLKASIDKFTHRRDFILFAIVTKWFRYSLPNHFVLVESLYTILY